MTLPYRAYNLSALRVELERDEGIRPVMYEDSKGIPTVGIGHNLLVPLCAEAIDAQWQYDVEQAEIALDAQEPHWRVLDAVRQRVLVNMMFNLGAATFKRFPKFWAAIGNAIQVNSVDWYIEAAKEMKASAWYKQVNPMPGGRADRLIHMMETGNL